MRLLALFALFSPVWGQDIVVEIIREQPPTLAIPDLNGSGPAQEFMSAFNQTLAADLEDFGVLRIRNKSLYPPSHPAQPSDVRPQEWVSPPASVSYLAYGYGAIQADQFVFRGWFANLVPLTPVFNAVYRGPAVETGARKSAHEFAAAIIRSFGGEPLFGTKIFFRSRRSGSEEIWVMDPDGANQRQITHSKSLIVSLGVSPDGGKFSFTTGWPDSPRLGVYSFDPVRQLEFLNPEASLVNTPSFTPDGKQMVYSASTGGCCKIYVADLDGGNRHQISSSGSIDTEPKVNPRTGREIAFVSDRSGPHQIYTMNLDGGDVHRLTTGEGYASNPSWRPKGQHLAFAWTRGFAPGQFNIFVTDIASHQYTQLTHNEGRNENPSWAPDGLHLVFMSTRSGSPQIWSMLADGTRLRQLTTDAANDTPVWSR